MPFFLKCEVPVDLGCIHPRISAAHRVAIHERKNYMAGGALLVLVAASSDAWRWVLKHYESNFLRWESQMLVISGRFSGHFQQTIPDTFVSCEGIMAVFGPPKHCWVS